ncbi:MAG: DMT family transporter [Candidatus Coatesbacteria bacterium]|nr:DMT family transporter [Candidatus Coatesbacteria bacterium]
MTGYEGETYAILSGLFWAIAVCFFKRGGADMPAVSLNLFKNIIGVGLFAITMPIAGQPLLIAAPSWDYAILVLSGIVGMTLGDTVFFAALKKMGASLWAIVSAFYGPSVILMSYIVLDEELGWLDLLGVAIIVGAIVLASTKGDEFRNFDRQRLIGVGLGVLSLLLMAGGIVMMKPVLDRQPSLWATQVRLMGATASLFIMALIDRNRRRNFESMLPNANWRYIVPGSVIGPYFALGFWIAGFKYTLAGKAAILNQLNTVFIFVFAWLFLRERLTWRKVLGLALALFGAFLIVGFQG